jgi:hypothetical protein
MESMVGPVGYAKLIPPRVDALLVHSPTIYISPYLFWCRISQKMDEESERNEEGTSGDREKADRTEFPGNL